MKMIIDIALQTTTEIKLKHATIELRRKTLEDGFAFMYFLESLPDDQVVYEYPDGRFMIEQIRGVDVPPHHLRPATTAEIATVKTNWLHGA